MAVVMGALLVVGLVPLIYADEPGLCLARDGPARRSSRSSAGAAAAPRGRRARPRRSTSPGPTPPRWPRTTRRRRATSRSRRSRRPPPPCSTPWPRRARASPRSTSAPSCPRGGPVASGQAAPRSSAPAGPGSASGPATAASPASSAGASSTTPGRPPTNTPGSSTPSASSWPSSRARPAHLRLELLEPEPDEAVRVGARATTGSTSSGRAGAARRPTSPCSQKAGIDVGEGVVIQFYPKEVEDQLAQLEVRYRGRQPAEIRVTRFSVVPEGQRLRLRGPRPGDAALIRPLPACRSRFADA